MTEDEIIEVLMAYEEGKKIQYSDMSGDVWYDIFHKPKWNFSSYRFRVKKEPRVVYVNHYSNGKMEVFEDRESAIIVGSQMRNMDYDTVKYQEVE